MRPAGKQRDRFAEPGALMSDPFKNSGSLLAEGGTFGNFFSGAENSALKMETTMTSLGATEQGLVHAVDVALDSYDKALTTRNPAEIAKARARLEGLREELEKVHKNIMALDSMKRAQPARGLRNGHDG